MRYECKSCPRAGVQDMLIPFPWSYVPSRRSKRDGTDNKKSKEGNEKN